MKTTSVHLLAAATLFLAALPSLHAQNLVANPGFETGNFIDGVGGYPKYMILNPGDSNITSWAVTTSEIAWGTVGNSDAVVPHGGNFFLDLEGVGVFSTPYGGVSQTVATTLGQTYRFSFFLGTQQSHANTHGPISVSATAGATTQTFTFDPTGPDTQWGQFGFNFTATSANTPISILGTFTNDGAYIGLDDVSVVAVPEPAANVALAIGGVLAAGAIWRRAKAARPLA